MEVEIPDNPNWANNTELKALNEKVDLIARKLDVIERHLSMIAGNTQPSSLGSSFRP